MKKIKTILFTVAIVLASLFLCSAGCQNAADSGSSGGGSGSGGGSSSGGGSGWSATSIGINMVSITGGTVHMSASYNPTVSNFYMSETEITQKQWKEVVGNDGYGTSKPSDTYGNGDNFPMYYVNWYAAIVFCNKLSVKEGRTPCYKKGSEADTAKWGDPPSSNDATWNAITCDWTANGYRLPTEAEWEYAARARNTTTGVNQYGNPDPTGANLGNYAWYSDNSGDNGGTANRKSHPVKGKTPNAHGMYDMSGNVWEWCWDWYVNPYDTSTNTDPHGPSSSGSNRVSRGGGWDNDAAFCAVSYRYNITPGGRSRSVGFRVVRSK